VGPPSTLCLVRGLAGRDPRGPTLVDNQSLRPDTDVDLLALALLAAIQGGLLLAQTRRDTAALEAALDTALAAVRSHATAMTGRARPRTRPANRERTRS